MPVSGTGKAIAAFSPAEARERIVSIDVTRTLALLAVLQINLYFYSGYIYTQWAQAPVQYGWGGKALDWLMNAFLNGRGMGLFSLLFAVGLSIQLERAQARGAGFWSFACRRLGALTLIGAVHILVIWNGDILVPYAVIGLIILPLLKARLRLLYPAFVLSIVLSLTYGSILHWLHAPDTMFWMHWWKKATWLKQMADQVYGHGTWWETARWRGWEWANVHMSINLMGVFGCLPFFILGLIIWRSRVLQNAASRRSFLRRSFHALFWPSILIIIAIDASDWLPGSWWSFWDGVPIKLIGQLSELACVVSYLFGVVLLFQHPWWERHVRGFAAMGRMSLTTYLTQSLVFTWFFCGYGAGFWIRLSVSAIFWIGMVFFAAQILWSRWWVGRFRFGPVEWLWRSMTYGRWQPLRPPPRR